MLPRVLAIIIRIKLKVPCATKNPANGITNSEGTGTTMLSSIMRKNIPAYPRRDIIERAKLPIAARISDRIDMSRWRKSIGSIYTSFSKRPEKNLEIHSKKYYLIKREVKSVGNMQRLATKEKPISVITTILN